MKVIIVSQVHLLVVSISDRWMTALTDTLHLPGKRWVIQTLNSNLAICKLSCTSSQALRVLYSVTVMPDYGWTLAVYGRQVDPNQFSLLCDVPMQLTSETLQSMLSLLHECNICAGHSDPDFVRMAEARKGKLLSQSGDRIVAYVDTSSGKTTRSSKCEVVVKAKKCSACTSYRATLRKSYHRWNKRKSLSPRRHVSLSSKTNFRFLNTPEKNKCYSKLRAKYDAKSKKVE